MSGSGFMKQAAEATAYNRAILKRNGRFSSPRNMFDQLKNRTGRSKKLYKYKKARPELLEAIREKIKREQADQTKKNRLILVFSIALVLLIIVLTIF